MNKYRKKTLIEAEQFKKTSHQLNKFKINFDVTKQTYWFETLEGNMNLKVNDWIATGVNGEHWAIADNIFKKTYEEVEDMNNLNKRIANYKFDGFGLIKAIKDFSDEYKVYFKNGFEYENYIAKTWIELPKYEV